MPKNDLNWLIHQTRAWKEIVLRPVVGATSAIFTLVSLLAFLRDEFLQSVYREKFRILDDLASRLVNRVQIPSDALRAYVDVVEHGFNSNPDYGQILKSYSTGEKVCILFPGKR